jgi:formylmethanofuran dehydrogenase subunit E
MGQYAGELLAVELPRTDRRLCCFVETDGCFADAVSVATGCRPGKRTLRLMDHGKVATTCVDVATGRAIRIWPDPDARSRAWRYAPDAPSPWHAQLVGYQIMPVVELLCSMPVTITVSMAALLSRERTRAECGSCGEEVFDRSEVDLLGRLVCAACAGHGYYTRLSALAGTAQEPSRCGQKVT